MSAGEADDAVFKLGSHSFGRYHIGLLYSETTFERVTVLGYNYPDRPIDDLLTSCVSHHEALHGLQDTSSGFGALVNEMMRLRDEFCAEYFQEDAARVRLVPLSASRDKSARKMTETYDLFDQLSRTLLENSTSGLSAAAIFEGAAAVYSEIYKRWHSLAEHGLADFVNIYDFGEVGASVMRMPELYRSAFRFFLAHAPAPRSVGEQCALLTTFLAVCDWALQVPPIEPKRVKSGSDIARYLPGDRFVAAVLELAKWKTFWAPMHLRSPDLVVSGANPGLTAQRSKAAEFVQRIHASYPQSDGDQGRWCDELSRRTGHPKLSDVFQQWTELFDDQIQRASKEKVLALRRKHMTARRTAPLMLASFPTIRSEILGQTTPIFCRTRDGMYYVGDMEAQGDYGRVVALRVFMHSISRQLVHSGVRTCPFANKTMISCPLETGACRGAIDVKQAKYASCDLGHMFEMLFRSRISDCAAVL